MNPPALLYVAVMIAFIVGLDIFFLRNKPLERLIVNVGIVMVFAAIYWRFIKHG